MRTKLFVTVTIALGIICGCEKRETIHQQGNRVGSVHYEDVIMELNKHAANSFKFAEKIKPLTKIARFGTTTIAKVETEKVSTLTGEYIVNNHFPNLKSVNVGEFAIGSTFLSSSNNARTSRDALASVLDTSDVFNHEQVELITQLTNSVAELEDITDAPHLIHEFNQKVANSESLNEEQKLQLFSFSALSNSFITFVESDAASEIYNSMVLELGISGYGQNNARTAACKVSWGNVWRGAVVGLALGAVRGGITGATVGTFTAPVIGTVTGGVSGAVAGGAVGFVEGAVAGVVADLLGSCFNNTQMQSVSGSCKEYFERFLRGGTNIESMPIHCGEINKDGLELIVYN